MKKGFKVTLISAVLICLLTAAGLVFYSLSPPPEDYGTFLKMRQFQVRILGEAGAVEKPVNRFFENYKLKLPLLYRIMFKAGNLSLYLKSYESEKIDTATANQLEIGNDTGNFFDFTFMIRPEPQFNVPLFHGDALKPLPGVTGALYMDFYSLNDDVDLNRFFAVSRHKLSEAMALAEPYWKHEGFGELTPHLDPFKSPYRLEMVEPEEGPEEEVRRYYQTLFTCYTLYTQAYLEALNHWNLEENPALHPEREQEVRDFVSILYEKDIAVKMGKMIFPEEDFDHYFLDGFWGTGPLTSR
jgi:hypothetical protein